MWSFVKDHKWLSMTAIALPVFVLGLAIPQSIVVPVRGAGPADWNHETFWHEPWGKSGVHKGIDIFAEKGTDVLSATDGIVIFSGKFGMGGKVLAVLGPKWRVHYYAHLDSSVVGFGHLVRRGKHIGFVGQTGNARNRPPHLHYSIVTMIPFPWRVDESSQGWKKSYYLNPSKILLKAHRRQNTQ